MKGGHVWVYRSDLVGTLEAAAGALVHVHDERGRKLGSALYSSASQIAIRLLTADEINDEQLASLLRERIARAVEFRGSLIEGKVGGTQQQILAGLKPGSG